MKSVVLSVILAFIFAGCKNEKSNNTDDSGNKAEIVSSELATSNSIADNIVNNYLKLKNALASDNDKEAANYGKALEEAISNFDKSKMTQEQLANYTELEDDMREHAEHIGANAGNISHQREHFDLLSKDMIDFVKIAGSSQTLYQEYCPMYDNNKGASWLSEQKEISNPYMGKRDSGCGSVQETISPK